MLFIVACQLLIHFAQICFVDFAYCLLLQANDYNQLENRVISSCL
jgi:hypothetical protein